MGFVLRAMDYLSKSRADQLVYKLYITTDLEAEANWLGRHYGEDHGYKLEAVVAEVVSDKLRDLREFVNRNGLDIVLEAIIEDGAGKIKIVLFPALFPDEDKC